MKNRVFLSITIFFCIIMLILFTSVYFLNKSTLNTLLLEQIDSKKSERIEFFDNYIDHETKILQSLAKNKDMLHFIETGENRSVVDNLFVTLAIMHKEIYQFRYIGINGNEIVRLDNVDKADLVEKDKLQNKKGRYYFEDTISKNKGEVYYSNIDLNVEHGQIEIPIVPTLRVATPIEIDGEKKGIVIVNINIEKFLKNIQKTSLYHVGLIYEDGHIIISEDDKDNWSRDFKKQKKVFDIYPTLAKTFYKDTAFSDERFFITKLNINTKNSMYLLLVLKEFKEYSDIQQNTKYMIYLLIIMAFLGIPSGYFLSKYIEKLYTEKSDMKQLVYVDELTKALNRKAYNERIQEKIDIYKRHGTKFCILMYDIDDFKHINDT